MVIMMS